MSTSEPTAAVLDQLQKATSSAAQAAQHLDETVKKAAIKSNTKIENAVGNQSLDQLKRFLSSHKEFEKTILDLPTDQMKHYELLIGDLRTGLIPRDVMQKTLKDNLTKVSDSFVALSLEHAAVISVGFAKYFADIRRENALKSLGLEELAMVKDKADIGNKGKKQHRKRN